MRSVTPAAEGPNRAWLAGSAAAVAAGIVAAGSVAAADSQKDEDDEEVLASDDAAEGGATTEFGRQTRGIERVARVVSAAVQIFVAYRWLNNRYAEEERNEDENEAYAKDLLEVRTKAAKLVLSVCKANGGVFNKLGQYLSTLDRALPQPIPETLAELQDRAGGRPFDQVRRVLQEELCGPPGHDLAAAAYPGGGPALRGRTLEDIFEWIEETPIGSASLAQVHRAKLRDGREVAIKVQYPGLDTQIGVDVWVIRSVLRLAGVVSSEWEYAWLLPDFERMLAAELDFVQEGVTASRVRRILSNEPGVYVPRVHFDLTTRRVLAMEFIRGFKVLDQDKIEQHGIDRAQLANATLGSLSRLLFVAGLVHCDPHPGNLLVRPHPGRDTGDDLEPQPEPGALAAAGCAPGGHMGKGGWQLVILDHGMYRRLDSGFRRAYCRLWHALITRDIEEGEAALSDLGIDSKYLNTLSLVLTYRTVGSTAGVGQSMPAEERAKLRARSKQLTHAHVRKFMQLLPRDLLFVLRSTGLMRGLNRGLGGSTRDRFFAAVQAALEGRVLADKREAEQEQATRSAMQGMSVSAAAARGTEVGPHAEEPVQNDLDEVLSWEAPVLPTDALVAGTERSKAAHRALCRRVATPTLWQRLVTYRRVKKGELADLRREVVVSTAGASGVALPPSTALPPSFVPEESSARSYTPAERLALTRSVAAAVGLHSPPVPLSDPANPLNEPVDCEVRAVAAAAAAGTWPLTATAGAAAATEVATGGFGGSTWDRLVIGGMVAAMQWTVAVQEARTSLWRWWMGAEAARDVNIGNHRHQPSAEQQKAMDEHLQGGEGGARKETRRERELRRHHEEAMRG